MPDRLACHVPVIRSMSESLTIRRHWPACPRQRVPRKKDQTFTLCLPLPWSRVERMRGTGPGNQPFVAEKTTVDSPRRMFILPKGGHNSSSQVWHL